MHSKKPLTVWTIALINVAAICNIKNFPLMAEYGLATVSFLVLAALLFFIPTALVAAELSSGWPERGVYTWVREAFGPRWGFLAIWLQWIENVIWYPTILSFIAATFAYMISPELATNKIYTLSMVLITFWGATLVNCLGMRVSGWISSIGAFCTIVPICLIIGLGILWLATGHPSQITFSWQALVPNFTSLNQLVLLIGFLFGLAGMEMSAVHARDVQHPKRNYPIAVLLSTLLILTLSILGSLAIAIVVPQGDIQLASGGMDAFASLFAAFNMPWATSIIAATITLGALGMMSTWIVGPSRGLLATAQHDGDLPPLLQKTNRHHMPVAIFITQGLIVTTLSMVFLLMPSVNSSYWILLALSSELYLTMYLLMFMAALRLRYTQPNTPRFYTIPFGKCGMWIVSGTGSAAALLAMGIGVLPPSQLDTGSLVTYLAILLGGVVLFCILPFCIYQARKPHWKQRRYD